MLLLLTGYVALERRIRVLGQAIIERHQLAAPTPVGVPTSESVVCTGRICCDVEGKLNDQSVVLQGAEVRSRSIRVIMTIM